MIDRLFIAAQGNYFEEAQRILSLGISPNQSTHDGKSVLHVATLSRNDQICELLIEHGAQYNTIDCYSLTRFLKAATEGHEQVGEVLLQDGQYLKDVIALHQSCQKKILAQKNAAEFAAVRAAPPRGETRFSNWRLDPVFK